MKKNCVWCYCYSGTLQSDWTPSDGGAYSFTNTSVIMAGGCRAVVDLCLSGMKYRHAILDFSGDVKIEKMCDFFSSYYYCLNK